MFCRQALIVSIILWSITIDEALLAKEIPSWSSSQIVAQILRRDEQLYAISLEYRDVNRYASHYSAPGEYLHRVISAKGPNLFKRDNGHGHDDMHLADDPFRKTIIYGDGGWRLLSHLNRFIKEGAVSSNGLAPSAPADEFIFRALSWWPFTDWTPPEIHGRTISLDTLFKNNEYQLRKAIDVVDGKSCLVFEIPMVDVFWLDATMPSRILRRDVYNTTTGAVATRFEFHDYKHYPPDIWLPGSIRNVQFDSDAHSAELRGRRVIDAEFLLSNVTLNENVADEMFTLNFPPGTVRGFRNGDEQKIDPLSEGQEAHFISIVEWGKRIHFKDDFLDAGYLYDIAPWTPFVFGFFVSWFIFNVSKRVGP